LTIVRFSGDGILLHWRNDKNCQKLSGPDPAFTDFFRSPEKFEGDDSGWYFALVVNDPDRGAFIEQGAPEHSRRREPRL
jgi:hypothetical protein